MALSVTLIITLIILTTMVFTVAFIIIVRKIWLARYYIDFEIKHLASTGIYITRDYARDIMRNGSPWKLRLWGMRENVPLPESISVERYKKGRIKLAALRDKEGNYSYLKTDPKTRLVETVTRNDRAFWLEEIEKSEMKRKKDMSSFILNITAIIVLGLVVGGHLMFWQQISDTATEGRSKDIEERQLQVEEAKMMESTARLLNEIITGKQYIDTQTVDDIRAANFSSG